MNKETFTAMTPSERVREVNKLLQEYDMKDISKLIGIPSSSFSQIMREGDYMYHKADKRYYPFVRTEAERIGKVKLGESDEATFVKQNRTELEALIQRYKAGVHLDLDKRIYCKDAVYGNKSIRMNTSIYDAFGNFCEEHYPHLKIQDLIAQSLLDFMKTYHPQKETG